MKALIQAAAILAIAMLAAAITWGIAPLEDASTCDPARIKEDEICLHDLPQDREILWIDARARSDWEKNGLDGSILWNFDSSEDFNALEAQAVIHIFNKPYVVIYCADKGCGTSRKIAEHIKNKLQLDAEVHILHNGWRALKEAGKVAGP